MKSLFKGNNSKLLYTLDKKFIVDKLSSYHGKDIPESLINTDYAIYRDNVSGLEFAHPMKAGSNEFYKWIAEQPGYYPKKRWEWGKVKEIIRDNNNKPLTVLDVGCGDGKFLKELVEIDNCEAVGIDTNEESIKKCVEKNLNAYRTTIEDYENQKFDYVCAFHVLEHVSNPISFVKEILKYVRKDGSVFLSTPYSPMSFEYNWFDPKNHPPHHLTRWNKKSYDALAKEVDCNLGVITPQPGNIFFRIIGTLKLKWYGSNKHTSKYSLFMKLIQNPISVLSELKYQINRERVNGKPAPNVILVQLKKR